MSAVFNQRAAPMLQGFDGPLAFAVFLLACAGLLTMYSSGFDHGTRFVDHARNMLIAGTIMFVVAQVPPQRLMSFAVPVYTIGVALLIAVAVFGITKKGARRWVNIGVVIQPSEILKIAMPLMLAWWFQKREGQLRPLDYAMAAVLLLVPVGLIMKQPDLGTSLLVLAAGMAVIFFAGLPWKLIMPPFVLIGLVAGTHRGVREPAVRRRACDGRCCTTTSSSASARCSTRAKDPLGKGFHIIQGMIAIGSGGLFGKGFMQGTQTHLEFIPERTTDFIFAAFSEEFGLLGNLCLIAGFIFLVLRGLAIALEATDAVLAPAGRRGHDDLLHLCLREHGHGERHPAGRGRSAAVHQLRRHRDGDAGDGPGHPDVHRPRQEARPELARRGCPECPWGGTEEGGCLEWRNDLPRTHHRAPGHGPRSCCSNPSASTKRT
jgi:rod shape determining protein RodA